MNLQEIVFPLAEAVEGSFESFLVPIADLFNWACVVGGVLGLVIWLRMQKNYTAKAKNEGTLV